ncbi:MAG: exodeoxyribonuclease VII small subunit [Pelosinus sp.]|nr:exodeoxyribonuclease VII small subunit [Pelosinus sp.]
MRKAKNKNSALSFEEALLNLETIVKGLEKGDLPLEESLAQFSDGVELSQLCLAKLNAAEQHIDKILQMEQGELVEKPLEL